MTHASVPDEQRALLGIDDTLMRLSVGIESCADLVADLDNALNAALKMKQKQQSTQSSFLPEVPAAPGNDEQGYWDW